MNRMLRGLFVVAGMALMLATAVGQNDRQGTKDYPGIKRMPNYYVDDYSEKEFDSATMPVMQGKERKDVAVEGRVYTIKYYRKDGTPETSMLQVVRNYQNAIRAAGGQMLDDQVGGNWRSTTLKMSKDGKEIWIYLYARDDNHELTVVEKQGMQQDVTVDAKALANDLKATGKVAVYGIYFDTGKSELKPESDAAVSEIAKMLKATPALKVFIVGHTDMVGDAASNVKLSQARAQSVVSELVTKHAIPAARLVAFGAGPYAPVASNRDEDGRAKNRRVELVEIATK